MYRDQTIFSSDFFCLHKPRTNRAEFITIAAVWSLPLDLTANPGGSKKYLEIYHKLSSISSSCHELIIAICFGILNASQEERKERKGKICFLPRTNLPSFSFREALLGFVVSPCCDNFKFKKRKTPGLVEFGKILQEKQRRKSVWCQAPPVLTSACEQPKSSCTSSIRWALASQNTISYPYCSYPVQIFNLKHPGSLRPLDLFLLATQPTLFNIRDWRKVFH